MIRYIVASKDILDIINRNEILIFNKYIYNLIQFIFYKIGLFIGQHMKVLINQIGSHVTP